MPRTQHNLDGLRARYRRLPAQAEQRELQDLYTDGCAEMLQLEAALLRLKRRLVAAEADSAEDQSAARRAAQLRSAVRARDEELGEIRGIVRLLRTAVDWTAPAGRPTSARQLAG